MKFKSYKLQAVIIITHYDLNKWEYGIWDIKTPSWLYKN